MCTHIFQVYQPLELLLFVAALCTISDAFLPSLIAIPKVGRICVLYGTDANAQATAVTLTLI
jgi:hypothetical protein